MSWMRKPWMKWGMPIGALALVAVLVTGGLALTGGAAVVEGDDDWGDEDWAENPSYSELAGVGIEAAEPQYTIALSEVMVVAPGSGEMFEVAVTAEALAADLMQRIVVSADIYVPNMMGLTPQWVAPSVAFTLGADGAPGVATVDDDGNGIVDWLPAPAPANTPDPAEVAFAGSDDCPMSAGPDGIMANADDIPDAVVVFDSGLVTLHPGGEIALAVFPHLTGIATTIALTDPNYTNSSLLLLEAQFIP